MTEEEMQKKMEFILERQAQFAANMELMREVQQPTDSRIADTNYSLAMAARSQAGAQEIMAALAEAQKRTDEKVAALLESQARTDRKMAKTDVRLNILINLVERHISEGHHGKSQG